MECREFLRDLPFSAFWKQFAYKGLKPVKSTNDMMGDGGRTVQTVRVIDIEKRRIPSKHYVSSICVAFNKTSRHYCATFCCSSQDVYSL